MAASRKFDPSSSPDRPSYAKGHCGTPASSLLDKSGSSCNTMENQTLSSFPSMARSQSAVTQENVVSYFQRLRFDPKSIVRDRKFQGQGDLERITSVALGIAQDGSLSSSSKGKLLSSSSAQELKKLKTGLLKSSAEARKRQRIFGEAFFTLGKYFPSVPVRKRTRADVMSADRESSYLSTDRSGIEPKLGNMRMASHIIANVSEGKRKQSEETAKTMVMTKCSRTKLLDSKMDMQANSVAKLSGLVEKDTDVVRLADMEVLAEDFTSTIISDGVGKSVLKKKRSVTKQNVSPKKLLARPQDGYRELELGMHQRLVPESQSRKLLKSHHFLFHRTGVANGSIGGKQEAFLQKIKPASHSSMLKGDQKDNVLIKDKKDLSIASDKERVKTKAINKSKKCGDYTSASSNLSKKQTLSGRGTWPSECGVQKLSPSLKRSTTASNREITLSVNRSASSAGVIRKSTPSTQSPSPSVIHWTGHRPKQISRMARRSNLLPIVTSNDAISESDTISGFHGNYNVSSFARHSSDDSVPQSKVKNDRFASATLSDSEDSGVGEIKSRYKKCREVDDKAGQSVQKGSTIVLPPKKTKVISGKDGDGVRRQGRSSRGSVTRRSLMPVVVPRLGNVGAGKRLGSSMMGVNKAGSKVGRPPTRKISERNSCIRNSHHALDATANVLDSGDGRENILVAKDVIDTSHTISSSFWRQMEPMFCFISEADLNFLKQQGEASSSLDAPCPAALEVDYCRAPNGFVPVRKERQRNFISEMETESVGHLSEPYIPEARYHNPFSLWQKLTAALITEEVKDFSYINGDELELDEELESCSLSNRTIGNSHATAGATLNKIGNGYRSLNYPEEHEPDSNSHVFDDLFVASDMIPDLPTLDCEYVNMSIREKLLLEVQSIGVFPQQPEMLQANEDEISHEIRLLKERYHGQVSEKRCIIGELLISASESSEPQQKEYEQNALDNLVTITYKKYMAVHASGGKSSNSKMARQAALDNVRRTLESCQEYEATGISCFKDPSSSDIFRIWPTLPNEAQLASGEYTELCHMASLSPRQNHACSSDSLLPENLASEQMHKDVLSYEMKKRKLLLDDVGIDAVGGCLTSSAKGKRSKRDKERKGRVGHPALSIVKGERKSKVKPKLKTTHLPASVNNVVGKASAQAKTSFSSMLRTSGCGDEFSTDGLEDCNGLDLSNLELPKMDFDLGGQGQEDIGSWLDIHEDDGLQDVDFMGLEIPMDDLSDLKMMV